MQFNAAPRMSQGLHRVIRCVLGQWWASPAVAARTSCRSAKSRIESQSVVRAPRGSAAPGKQFVAGFGGFCVAKVPQSRRGLARPARASSASWSAQARSSTARCPSAAALSVKLGHSQAKGMLLSPAACRGTCLQSLGASKLTVANASQVVGCGCANAAPNHPVKRTAPGVPGSAAYLKRWVLQERMQMPRNHASQAECAARGCR